MKKVIIAGLAAMFTMLAGTAVAQQFTTYTISPAVYTAEDEITITVDLTGTAFVGSSDAYIWTWANEENGGGAVDGKVNTAWGASPDAAKLTAVAGSPNKFTYKLLATDMYNLTPGALKHFQFLIKAKDGSKQTNNTPINKFDPLVFIPSLLRVFPAKVGANDVISLYFHQDLATSINDQRLTPVSVTVVMYDNDNAAVGQPLTLTAKSAGTKLFRAYFVPSKAFTPATGKKLTRFTYKFNGTVRDENNAVVTVSTATAEVTLNEMK